MKHALRAVQGEEKLLSVFEEWPSFHDAEVLSIQMDRDEPAIIIRVFVFKVTHETDEGGYFKRTRTSVVTLGFHGVSEVALEGFNHQNVLAGLSIRTRDVGGLEVVIDALYGVGGRFTCESAEVVDVAPSPESQPPPLQS